MYPDRRPYATTVPHSGYRLKPLVPQPPTDALLMLRSHVGFDDLRGSANGSGSGAAAATALRLSAGRGHLADGTSASSAAVQQLLPATDRSPQEALQAARLERPIEHESLVYHGCQQAALNAELREKVEAKNSRWVARVAALASLLEELPMEGAVYNAHVLEGLRTYLQAYRCTEDLSVTAEDLAAQLTLRTPVPEIGVMSEVPPLPMDAMRRALDDLLQAPFLLAPLDAYLTQLSLLDKLSRLTFTGEGEVEKRETAKTRKQRRKAPADELVPTDADAVAEAEVVEDVFPALAAVALHERLHYNPGDYAQRELMRSEEALRELQARVQTVKQHKEDAIDAADPLTALRNLHAQVDFSNDLLLLYKARMALVAMHADDTRDFRKEVVDLIEDSHAATQTVTHYARVALPSVQHDVRVLADTIDASQKKLEAMQVQERAAEEAMRDKVADMDKEARALWTQVGELLGKLSDNARERARFSQRCMSLREQRAKEAAAEQAQLRAQTSLSEKLCHCEDVLTRWTQAGDVYGKYVDACVPKVLKHLAAVEEADVDLAQREAEEYVGFYEQFVYAAEEARAKRRTQADRMRLLQRSVLLNQERAEETMDPDAAAHAQRLSDAGRELDEVEKYLQYVEDMEADRRAEVDPVLKGVLVRHTQAQLSAAAANGDGAAPVDKALPTPGLLKDSATAADEVDAAPLDGGLSADAAGEEGALVLASGDENVPLTGTAAHPFVTARVIGLAHENNYLDQQGRLAEQELHAVEEKRTGLRHSREELRAMENKYKNGDDIRALLGLER